MQKFLVVIALILSLSHENLAWKNWNHKSYLETRRHSCLEENKIFLGLRDYVMDSINYPNGWLNFIKEIVSICENSMDPVRCLGIEAAFR